VSLRTHRIERGDSLSGIAWSYGTSVKALAAANGLSEDQVIKTGQLLVIPQHARPGGGEDWLKYAAVAKQRGHLDLVTHKARFRGPVVENGRLLPAAREAISALLGVKGSRPPLSERLIRLLVRVSDTFGGRQLWIVSGYRASSYFSDSRHKRSEAVDFAVVGVPNAVLRQYLLLLDDVGVGYYPNSSFVHLDVRGCSMQWVDYAGPGEAPRRSPRQPAARAVASKAGPAPRRTPSRRVAALDEIAEKVAAAMEAASTPRPSLEAADGAASSARLDPTE
jgi:LysM repeat protein